MLAANTLTIQVQALALIGIRLTKLLDFRGYFTNELLIDSSDVEAGWRFNLEGDSFWGWKENGVAVTKSELKILALLRYTITNTNDGD